MAQGGHPSPYDMPRQMNDHHSSAALERKRQELVQWEDSLIHKSQQMEEAAEQFNIKMGKMATQKAEIQANVKKL